MSGNAGELVMTHLQRGQALLTSIIFIINVCLEACEVKHPISFVQSVVQANEFSESFEKFLRNSACKFRASHIFVWHKKMTVERYITFHVWEPGTVIF